MTAQTDIDAYLIGLRYSHHAGRSGYESFHRYLRAPFLRPPFRSRQLERGWRLDHALQQRLDRPCYTVPLLAQELAALPHLARHRDAPHHMIYADTDLRFLGRFGGSLGTPVVATFHEPPWALDYMRIDRRVVRDLAGVILVSESQREWFTDLMPADRIFVIPHGADTSFFTPAPSIPPEPRIIIVGSKYRDFDVLSEAVDMVRAERPDAQFVAVGAHRNRDWSEGDIRFVESSPPDDFSLRAEYRRSRAAVFPMMFATANNALLEAMACGLPIVATDVGGIREYVDDAAVLCEPGDPGALARAMLDVITDDDLATRLGAAARERVLRFDFAEVALQHRAAYRAARS